MVLLPCRDHHHPTASDKVPYMPRNPVLQVLLLDSNMLTELPAGIGHLLRLERLSVAHNNLAALPASLGQLQKLQVSRLQLQG